MNLRSIVGTKPLETYSPSSQSMYQPITDIPVGRAAKKLGNIKMQQYSFLVQLAHPRHTIVRQLGQKLRLFVLGNTVGELGWGWELKEDYHKPGMYVMDLEKGQKPQEFVVMNVDDWVAQEVQVAFMPSLSFSSTSCIMQASHIFSVTRGAH